MCLSTIYIDEINKENIIMKNVMNIEVIKDEVVLTDLMEKKLRFKGTLTKANLVDGYVIVHMEGNAHE